MWLDEFVKKISFPLAWASVGKSESYKSIKTGKLVRSAVTFDASIVRFFRKLNRVSAHPGTTYADCLNWIPDDFCVVLIRESLVRRGTTCSLLFLDFVPPKPLNKVAPTSFDSQKSSVWKGMVNRRILMVKMNNIMAWFTCLFSFMKVSLGSFINSINIEGIGYPSWNLSLFNWWPNERKFFKRF